MLRTAAGRQLTPFSKFLDSSLSWQDVASSSPFSTEFVFSNACLHDVIRSYSKILILNWLMKHQLLRTALTYSCNLISCHYLDYLSPVTQVLWHIPDSTPLVHQFPSPHHSLPQISICQSIFCLNDSSSEEPSLTVPHAVSISFLAYTLAFILYSCVYLFIVCLSHKNIYFVVTRIFFFYSPLYSQCFK